MIVYEINPLPDFLTDHTLPPEAWPDRLKEVASRWISAIGALHVWADQASFAIRFISRQGRVRAFFVAVPAEHASPTELRSEIEALLRTHRLIQNPQLNRIEPAVFTEVSTLKKPVFLTLAQKVVRHLWKQSRRFLVEEKDTFSELGTDKWEEPQVVLPWRGPGGPFLLPLEALLSQPIPAAVTALLTPTHLRPDEFAWFRHMAMAAQSVSDEMFQRVGAGAAARQADPAASLAAKLYETMLRRLVSTTYATLIQVTAEDGRNDVLRSVAAAVQAQPLEHPIDEPDKEVASLPSGCEVFRFDDRPEVAQQAESELYTRLNLLEVSKRLAPLDRIPLLTDARGAATLFRFPVSIRGGVPGLAVRQLPPDFRPGPRLNEPSPNCLMIGRFRDGGVAEMPVRDLTRHALVTGFTGTGKTVTVLQLLHQVWIDHGIPFLVLESAKQEYRGLMRVEAFSEAKRPLRIYTLGNERAVPIRINPFELLPGVRVEAHLGRLQSCLEGAIPPVGPSSSIIAEALIEVYEKNGWQLTDECPSDRVPKRRMPTFTLFTETVESIIERRGYRGELLDNLRAALVGRFKPLLIGGKGRMFETQRSDPPISVLFDEPTILEMNDLNLEDKALLTMFLLTLLREHRERCRGDGESLVHLTVVEEAHNILENVSSVGGGEGATAADTRFKAVQAFCAMLAEIRSLGEGMLIADQSPQKLAKDAVRNTNLQLAHQLRDAGDREAISTAMIMEDVQCDFLGKLDRGHAAFFRTGLEKATFVKIDQYYPNPSQITASTPQRLKRKFRGFGFRPDLADAEIVEHMQRVEGRNRREIRLPLPGCELCAAQCNDRYRDACFALAENDGLFGDYTQWFETVSDKRRMKSEGLSPQDAWSRVGRLCARTVADEGLDGCVDAAWCYFAHAWARCARTHAGAVDDNPGHMLLSPAHHEAFVAASRLVGANTAACSDKDTGRGPPK